MNASAIDRKFYTMALMLDDVRQGVTTLIKHRWANFFARINLVSPTHYNVDDITIEIGTNLPSMTDETINQQLAFIGYQLNETGKFSEVIQAKTISEAQQRAKNLKTKLENRNAHLALFKYCKAELLTNNYFHAVFEANKGLFDRIRDLSLYNEDGNKLIEYVFSNIPILIINNFQSKSEIDEHKGFCNLLKGLCGMFRNPEAHEPKISWNITEQDALEILAMISYCHRRLDNAQKIR